MIEVLVVDDDFMVARIHTGFVERTPGFTRHRGRAHAARRRSWRRSGSSPTWCCSTSTCPTCPVWTCSPRLREAAPEVDVLVISAAREADTVRRALRGGIVHYLMKPFSYDDLRVRLEHYQQAYGGLSSEQADQADVDRLFGVAGADKRLPKGFSPETLRLVEDSLRSEGGDLSAAEAAGLLGISRVSARRYLEHLTETGKVEVSLRYGEVGRPERRYAWR